MTDYTQLANEAKARLAEVDEVILLTSSWKLDVIVRKDVPALADALLACQRERDKLAAAIFGEPQPDATFEETRRMAADQVAAYDNAELHAAELSSVRDAADVPLPEQLTLEGEVVDG